MIKIDTRTVNCAYQPTDKQYGEAFAHSLALKAIEICKVMFNTNDEVEKAMFVLAKHPAWRHVVLNYACSRNNLAILIEDDVPKSAVADLVVALRNEGLVAVFE